MILDCDYSISVQLIPYKSAKCVTRVQKSLTRIKQSTNAV